MPKKLVYGVGINDSPEPIFKEIYLEVDGKKKRKVIWKCPYYSRWSGILERCYSKRYLKKRPTYEGCYVNNDWHYFSIFKSWMETQDWENKELDKDILIPGNKEYGPDTCVFVDGRVNRFLIERKNNGILTGATRPIGKGKKFRSICIAADGISKHLGYFSTEEDAHEAWLSFKIEQAYILAAEQKDKRVADALIYRYENYSTWKGEGP